MMEILFQSLFPTEIQIYQRIIIKPLLSFYEKRTVLKKLIFEKKRMALLTSKQNLEKDYLYITKSEKISYILTEYSQIMQLIFERKYVLD